ncbi:hypothetical protein [Streptomyces sp. NBC_01483]|uniref:hypothetical protein n=1 Tax=Streptomyces sp. NBC_01483 TaxID=2903883 RepID=UPI002E35F0B2|nr:hypothetical protein [Streptomyces sp. NBC_01483]
MTTRRTSTSGCFRNRSATTTTTTTTEYYDLRADPHQLTTKLHGSSAEQERRLGVPELARQLTAARAT